MNWLDDPKYSFYWKNYTNFTKNDPKTEKFLENYNKVFNACKKAHSDTMKILNEINWNDVKYNPNNSNANELREEFEFEIDPEIIKFYEESFKYKRERQRKKKLNKDKYKPTTGEQLNLFSQESTTNAPLEIAGMEREEELKLMYGDKAKEIQYLETTLQMIHDKNYDLYQPKYWPSFPLRIKFN